jgi:hypothetical protein
MRQASRSDNGRCALQAGLATMFPDRLFVDQGG